MTSSRTLFTSLLAGALVLVGCSAGSTDYKAAAEKAITSAQGGLGAGSTAKCDTPSSTAVGTTFKCVGTAADGTVYPVIATIDKKDHVTVKSVDNTSGGTTDTTGTGTGDTTATTVADTTATTGG